MELGKGEGFGSTLQLLQQALAKYLKVEQRAHWLPIQERTNQLWRDNDVIMSDRVRPIRLRHLEIHARTLDIWGKYAFIYICHSTFTWFHMQNMNIITLLLFSHQPLEGAVKLQMKFHSDWPQSDKLRCLHESFSVRLSHQSDELFGCM